jgi:hypothetical protein
VITRLRGGRRHFRRPIVDATRTPVGIASRSKAERYGNVVEDAIEAVEQVVGD